MQSLILMVPLVPFDLKHICILQMWDRSDHVKMSRKLTPFSHTKPIYSLCMRLYWHDITNVYVEPSFFSRGFRGH